MSIKIKIKGTMQKFKIFYRSLSSKTGTTTITSQELNIFNTVEHQTNLLAHADNINSTRFHILDPMSNRIGPNALSAQQLRDHRNGFYSTSNLEMTSGGGSTPRSITQVSLIENNGVNSLTSSITPNTTLINLNSGPGGALQNAVIIPVPHAPLVEGEDLHVQYEELVNSYFRGDIFNPNYIAQHRQLSVLIENLRTNESGGLNVNFTTLRNYQLGVQGTWDASYADFGRHRNLALVLNFFSTSALNIITQTFSHGLNSASTDSLMLFSIFTVSFMGLWIMTLPLVDLFYMPVRQFHNLIGSIASRITLGRGHVERIRDIRTNFANNLQALRESLVTAVTNLVRLQEEFVADFNAVRANSTAQGWYQFFRKWARYLCGIQISGAIIWFYNHPIGNRIVNALLNRLYEWITSASINPLPLSPSTDVPLEQIVTEELINHFRDHGEAYINFLFAYF
jgi:hypothetical protein